MSRKFEILAPAGNLEKLKFAVMYGADAVYCAVKRFGMRASADNFSFEELREGIDFAHGRGAKVYCTLNVMPRDSEFEALYETLEGFKTAMPDAFIASDPGLMTAIREVFPQAEIHLSTQCSTVNTKSCLFWHKAFGIKRIVLARELSLEEIKRIRAELPEEIEIEVFVHGSMCISYSGRCLLSNYATNRDANRGECSQPCRWQYRMSDIRDGAPMADIEEDSTGTYAYSSKDLCMIEHIPELVEAGINSFKIEGRMKSAYYTAAVTNAYRMASDSYIKNGADFVFDKRWLTEVESVSHREYATGFFFTPPSEQAQVCDTNQYLKDRAYLATVKEYDEERGLALCIQRNKFCVGDKVQLLTRGECGRDITVEKLYDTEMNEIESVPHAKQEFYVPIQGAKKWDILRMN